jgi:hypothetical protein
MGYVKKDFLKGLAMALAIEGAKIVAPDVPEPIAYSYNGAILPALPELSAEDKEKYPHLVISTYLLNWQAYMLSSPLTAEPGENFYGDPIYALTAKAPFLRCELSPSMHDRDKWTEWETVDDVSEFNFNSSYYWVDHDVVAFDGTILYKRGNRNPIYLPCVIYEGDVITEDNGYGKYTETINLLSDIANGDVCRITVDGVSGEYTAEIKENDFFKFGNRFLTYGDYADDGGDWYMVDATTFSALRSVYFYTRTPGTHHVKIELLEVAKE